MKRLIYLLLISGLAGCLSKSNIQLKEYYFPVNKFTEPKVYKFVDANDTTNIVYWRLSLEIKNNDTLFTTRGFNSQKQQIELFEEKITSKGALATNFIDIYDTKTLREGSIKENEVFLWNASTTYSYKIFVKEGQYILEKLRTPTTQTVTREFDGDKFNSIVMKDLYKTRDIDSEEVMFTNKQETYYAKDIGIIGYKRWLPNGEVFDFYLDEIQSAENFKVIK